MNWKNIAQPLFDILYEQSLRHAKPKLRWQGTLIAHRGVYKHPTLLENTLPAFELAASKNAGIELDVQLSLDGIPMVHHDISLERLFASTINIHRSTCSEIQTAFPVIPTLREVFKRFQHTIPQILIEFKAGDTQQRLSQNILLCRKLVHEYHLESKVQFISLEPEIMRLIAELTPEIPRAMVFLISHRKALAYTLTDSQCGLYGWFYTYPDAFLKQKETPLRGVGFANYKNTFIHLSQQNWPFIFTDRIDRLIA